MPREETVNADPKDEKEPVEQVERVGALQVRETPPRGPGEGQHLERGTRAL